MTTKYNIGDIVLIPFRIDGIRIDKSGVSYIINVNLVQPDDTRTYFPEIPASISEEFMVKTIERRK